MLHYKVLEPELFIGASTAAKVFNAAARIVNIDGR